MIACFLFNLCVVRLRIFSTSGMFSSDAQVYVARVQMAEQRVWFPAGRRWKAACPLPLHPDLLVQLAGAAAHAVTLAPRHLY